MEALSISIAPGDPIGTVDPAAYDFIDIAFRWRVANRGTGAALLGGRILISQGGVVVLRVDPGDRYAEQRETPRSMLYQLGLLSELPPGAVSEVTATLQVGVERLRGQGPFDITVQACDASQALGRESPSVLEHTETGVFSVGA
jgi:hypothetical protein